jgi:hypothetical protein
MGEDFASWWSSVFADTEFAHIPQNTPDIATANRIWSKISPILRAHLFTINDQSSYWKAAVHIMSLLSETECPGVVNRFPSFLEFFHIHRAAFYPTTPDACLKYIAKFCPTPPGDFFIFDLPRATGDTILGIRTLVLLHRTRNSLWRGYISQNGSVERILSLFLPFLTPLIGRYDPHFWVFRLELCEFLCTLFAEGVDKLVLWEELLAQLNRAITSIIQDSPPEITANFFRHSVQLNRISLHSIAPETATKRLAALLKAAPPISVVHEPVFRFVLSFVPEGLITYQEILAALTADLTLLTLGDLCLLRFIASRPTCESQLLIVRSLSRVLALNPLYCRAAGKLIARIISKLEKGHPANNWFATFVKRLVMFVGLAFAKHRYRGRISRIAEILSSPQFEEVRWLWEQIVEDVSNLVAAGACPLYFSDLFIIEVERPSGAEWRQEFDQFRSEQIPLKQFPFGVVGSQLYEAEINQPKRKRTRKKAAKQKQTEDAAPSVDAAPRKRGRRPKWRP